MIETAPLAEKLRPKSLDEFVGQDHLVGPGQPLRVAMEKQHIFSFILWGPPGVGKTTLARLYAQALGREFMEISAVSAGKDEMRQAAQKKVVLFVDEIHRFNKAQQDFLLPYVERGELVLIGATTENPSFEIIAPLLSRCRVFVFSELTTAQMGKIIDRTQVEADQEAKDWLIAMANGDARQAITMIENTQELYGKITLETLKNTLQSKHLRYDKLGEEHYNTISAFIKSMRASDTDAALYYLARMVDAEEDPLFIARRMVVFASEDVASPTAIVVANAVFRACEIIGYPECQENLAAGAVYLAQANKDRRAYDAYMAALADVKKYGNLPIPLSLRNAPTKLMKELGYSLPASATPKALPAGKGYQKYTQESLLPEELKNKRYYNDRPGSK